MQELMGLPLPLLVSSIAILLLLFIWLIVRWRRDRDPLVLAYSLLEQTTFDELRGIVVPSAEEGEIQLDRVVLTANAIVVVEVKDIRGVVFGSDRMQDWTVINGEQRFTFSNPQIRLLDCVAAVRQIVPDDRVEGVILFTDTAEFTKGVPNYVSTASDWSGEHPRIKVRERDERPAHLEHAWEKLRDTAVDAQVGKLFR